MTIQIDPDFSVYKLVKRSRQASIVLHDLDTMKRLSHRIEKRLLNTNLTGDLFVGFQYLSRFQNRQALYETLAKDLRHVYVFGCPDIDMPSVKNIHFVPLKETDSLSNDWFLIYYGQDYFTALVGRQKDNQTTQPESRQYAALWTFNLDIITILTQWLARQLDLKFVAFDDQEYDDATHGDMMDDFLDDYLDLE